MIAQKNKTKHACSLLIIFYSIMCRLRAVILTEVTLHSGALVLLKLGDSITEKCYYQLLPGQKQRERYVSLMRDLAYTAHSIF